VQLLLYCLAQGFSLAELPAQLAASAAYFAGDRLTVLLALSYVSMNLAFNVCILRLLRT
jgi:hypothetical protein